MRFFTDQTFTCPVMGCEWMVIAERGDTSDQIERILTNHAGSHGLVMDEALDYLRFVGLTT